MTKQLKQTYAVGTILQWLSLGGILAGGSAAWASTKIDVQTTKERTLAIEQKLDRILENQVKESERTTRLEEGMKWLKERK